MWRPTNPAECHVHVVRGQIARLMRLTGLCGLIYDPKLHIAITAKSLAYRRDLVHRDCMVKIANRLWNADDLCVRHRHFAAVGIGICVIQCSRSSIGRMSTVTVIETDETSVFAISSIWPRCTCRFRSALLPCACQLIHCKTESG